MTGTDVFEFRSVSKVYETGPVWRRRKVEAIRDVSFRISAGRTLAMVGESGSGKTTISKLCLGLIAPTSGEIFLEYEPQAKALSGQRGRFSAVLQNPSASLNPRFNVAWSILEPIRVTTGMRGVDAAERVRTLLNMVGLPPDFAERYPLELSGGQRQRVAIARALATEPRFIVFDEAVSALDVSVQTQVLNLILDLQERQNFSSLFITHDFRAARYVGSTIGVMRHGRLVEMLDRAEAYGPTTDRYIAALSM
jgi:ABC-type glutathione transport system ATPase component